MKKIQDEFTNRKVSHQRKSQLRNVKKGLCKICGKPKITSSLCEFHRIQKAFNRKRRNIKTTKSHCKFCGKGAYFRFLDKHLKKYHR